MMMRSMQSQHQGVVPAAAPFAESPAFRLMLSSAAAAPHQEPVHTPWHHMNHDPTTTQPPPMNHAGAEAIPTATTRFCPYPSPHSTHNPSLVPDFPTFSHGSDQPWSFDFQSDNIPFLLDPYPFVYQQQETMQLYDYDDNANGNPDNMVSCPADLTASGHDLEEYYQPDATSVPQVPNPSVPFHGSFALPLTEMATGFRMSMDMSLPPQGESDWEMVPGRPEDYQYSSESTLSSISGSPLEEPFQYIPSYSDQPQEVYSGYTACCRPYSEALDQVSLEYPITKPKKRGALSATERQQTSKTRQMTACIRCQMQRKRCVPDPNDESGPCVTCKTVNDSKKVIHKMGCIRWKLTAATVFRQAHLKLTKRWKGNTMYDIPASDWADDEIRVIQMSEGLCSQPFEIKVRRFKPQPGDVTDRFWTDRHGVSHASKLPPYAIASVGETCKQFVKYAEANTFEAVEQFANRHDVHPIVQETYKAAWNHMRYVTGISGSIVLQDFMKELWGFWFVLRHTIGSSELVGDEHLGIKPEAHEDYPFPPGHVSVPRMVCQQFTSIVYDTLLRKKRQKILRSLWALMQSKDPNCFETIYFAVFILLHEISATSKDRFRWSRENQIKGRYDMEESMESLHEGANIILCVWTYFRRGLSPVDVDWDVIRNSPPKAKAQLRYGDIESEMEKPISQIKLEKTHSSPEISRYSTKRKVVRPEPDRPFVWERDMHFTSQMFQADWHAQKQWERSDY
ncbi:hypothetical protein PG995_005617 [Apiospora arundinis]|uniref:Zn(2)-C6 fungal-type domain-containing protein n=1 Tax=Apiospora arundinis TaxID=335852 RepID=A0ABR2ICP0_9PEZI